MERLTERDSQGNKLVLKNSVECTTENIKKWSVSESAIGSITIRGEAVDKLARYEDLEEQGLLLKLPCKVGDTVYTACAWGIESGVVGSIEIISDRIFVNNTHGEMIGEAHNIFLTQAEAEQKLKEMKS